MKEDAAEYSPSSLVNETTDSWYPSRLLPDIPRSSMGPSKTKSAVLYDDAAEEFCELTVSELLPFNS